MRMLCISGRHGGRKEERLRDAEDPEVSGR